MAMTTAAKDELAASPQTRHQTIELGTKAVLATSASFSPASPIPRFATCHSAPPRTAGQARAHRRMLQSHEMPGDITVTRAIEPALACGPVTSQLFRCADGLVRLMGAPASTLGSVVGRRQTGVARCRVAADVPARTASQKSLATNTKPPLPPRGDIEPRRSPLTTATAV